MEQEPAKGNVVMMLIIDGLDDHGDGRLNVVYFGWCNKDRYVNDAANNRNVLSPTLVPFQNR
jgi:hypothetical protein